MLNYTSFEDYEREYYAKHPDRIPLRLDVSIEESCKDGDWASFLSTLETIAEARGGLGKLARQLKCSRTTLYRTLSANGNPRLATLAAILRALGLRLSIQVAGDEAVIAKAPRAAKAAKARKPVPPIAAKPRTSKPRATAAKTPASVVKAPVKARRMAAKGRGPKA